MKMYGHHRANHFDNPMAWDSEGAYIPAVGLSGLSDALPAGTGTPATSTVPWWQGLATSLAQTYATVKQATVTAKAPAPAAAPATTGISTNQMLLYGGLAVGAVLLFSMVTKKRR